MVHLLKKAPLLEEQWASKKEGPELAVNRQEKSVERLALADGPIDLIEELRELTVDSAGAAAIQQRLHKLYAK